MSGRPTKGGLVQVTLTLDPAHLEGLREEAQRRAQARKSARIDSSAVLREILDAWLKKQAAKKK